MRTPFLILIFIFLFPSLNAQVTIPNSTGPKYKFTISGGICALNPEEINDHIAASNTVFTSTARTIKSAPEFSAALSMRPFEDDKMILLRGGYISIERTYRLSVPMTVNDPDPTGYISGTVKETYTAYPISVGVGITSPAFESQLQFEFIFGLGYMEEEGTFSEPSGRSTSYLRSLFSPAYGFRGAGNTTVRLANRIGLTIEAGYRFLSFHEYEDEATTQSSNIEFSYSGVQLSIGLSFFF